MPGPHLPTQQSPWSTELSPWFHAASAGKDPRALSRAMAKTSPHITAPVRHCFVKAVSRRPSDAIAEFDRLLQNLPSSQRPPLLPHGNSGGSAGSGRKRKPSRNVKINVNLAGRDRELEVQLLKARRARMLGLEPLSAEELEDIEWKLVGDVVHLAGGEGSSGVYLVDVGGRGVVVKPGSLSTAGEYFCSLLYEKVGMRVPKQRILLSRSDGEFEKLRAAVGRRADAPGASEGKLRLKIELEKGNCVAVVEYIRSKPIWELSRASEVDRQRLLNQIGKTMALDILVNNGDRLPFIHRGEGNPSNLLLCKHQEYADLLDVCLIDNNVNAILNPEGRDKYLQLVSNVSKEIFVGNLPPTKIHGMDAIATFLLIHADLQVDFDEAVAIMEGMQSGMRDVVSLCTSDPFLFHRMKQQTVRAFQRAPGEIPVLKPGIDAIAEDFLQLVQIRFL